jgi:hypothetical protein
MIIFPRDRDSPSGSSAQSRVDLQTASRKRQFRPERIKNITSLARSRGRTRQRERGFYWTERGNSGGERLDGSWRVLGGVAGSLFSVWCDGCDGGDGGDGDDLRARRREERIKGHAECRATGIASIDKHHNSHPVTRLLDNRARPAEIRRTSPPSRGNSRGASHLQHHFHLYEWMYCILHTATYLYISIFPLRMAQKFHHQLHLYEVTLQEFVLHSLSSSDTKQSVRARTRSVGPSDQGPLEPCQHGAREEFGIGTTGFIGMKLGPRRGSYRTSFGHCMIGLRSFMST